MVGSGVFTSTILHLDQTLSCRIPLQISIFFDSEVCSSLAMYIVFHKTSRVVFDRERLILDAFRCTFSTGNLSLTK